MPLAFACPICNSSISATEEMAGRSISCPECAEKIRVPQITKPKIPAKKRPSPQKSRHKKTVPRKLPSNHFHCPACNAPVNRGRMKSGEGIICKHCKNQVRIPQTFFEYKEVRILLGLILTGGLTLFACGGCVGVIDGIFERQAEYAKTPAGKADAAKREKKSKERRIKVAVWVDVQSRIAATLKNPRSADYGDQYARGNVALMKDGTYFVKGWVDAENTFGGTVRSEFAGFYEVGESGEVYRIPDRWAMESR